MSLGPRINLACILLSVSLLSTLLSEPVEAHAEDSSGSSRDLAYSSILPVVASPQVKYHNGLQMQVPGYLEASAAPLGAAPTGGFSITAWVWLSFYPNFPIAGISTPGSAVVFQLAEGQTTVVSTSKVSMDINPATIVPNSNVPCTDDCRWHFGFGARSTSFGPSAGVDLDNPDQIVLNRWYFVAGIVDNSGTIRMYIDGMQKGGNQALPALSGLSKIEVGNDGTPGSQQSSGPEGNFPGKIDEIRVYNKALSASELSIIMTTNALVGGETALYHMDSTDNNNPAPGLVRDSSGNGFHLTKLGRGLQVGGGNFGEAFYFPDRPSYLQSANPALAISGDLSITLAFSRVDGGQTDPVIWGDRTATQDHNTLYDLQIFGSNAGSNANKLRYRHEHDAGVGKVLTSTGTVSVGFHTLTLRRDNTARTVTIKLDGAVVINAGTYTVAEKPNGGLSAQLRINDGLNEYFGNIEVYELRVWDHLISQATLDTIANPALLGAGNFESTAEGTETGLWFFEGHAHAPISNPDTYPWIGTSQSLTISNPGVLENDYDPDGDTITATGYSSPSRGTVSGNPDGSFTYTPSGDFGFSSDSFTYSAMDASLSSPAALVTIGVCSSGEVSSGSSLSFGFAFVAILLGAFGLVTILMMRRTLNSVLVMSCVLVGILSLGVSSPRAIADASLCFAQGGGFMDGLFAMVGSLITVGTIGFAFFAMARMVSRGNISFARYNVSARKPNITGPRMGVRTPKGPRYFRRSRI